MYWVIWPNKNIWEIQTPATTYVRITEKRPTLNYIIGGRKTLHGIYVWVSISLYNHTSWTDTCQNLASYWDETKFILFLTLGNWWFQVWLNSLTKKMIYSNSLLSGCFERHRLNAGIIYAKPGKIYTRLHLITV